MTRALTEQIGAYRITHGITCLAIGADQLYAEILLQKGIPFTVIVPSRRYEETFAGEDRERYFRFLSLAGQVVEMTYDEPGEIAFFAAGKEVVDRSEIMLAVWNGQKARGLGGTADIVKYALARKSIVIHINPITRVIKDR